MIYPNKLKKGDIIKIISPSNGVTGKKIEELDRAINYLKKNGYLIIEDKYTRFSNYGVSADKYSRARELNNSFLDNSAALIAVSGGNFINQIMDIIDFNTYLSNIKWIQGYSDITILLYYLTTHYDIANIYNFNIKGYSQYNKKAIDYAMLVFENKLKKQEALTSWEPLNQFDNIEGRIIGGCLESLKDIIGTKYDSFKKFAKKYSNDGFVWYFDISSFTNEDISRTMWQFKKMGYFKNCKAILFGRLREERSFSNLDFKKVVIDELGEFNIPIIINCDIGHTAPVITIINGSYVKISKQNNKFVMETILK